jgi:hypothetical protein
MHEPIPSGLAAVALRDQPAPRPGDGDVWAEVIPTLPPEIRADAEARRQLGIERYGTPLQRGNGRDMAVDGYQEALDGIAYSAGIEVGDPATVEEIRRVAVRLALLYRHLLQWRRNDG